MFIYNDIVWEKDGNETHLRVRRPKTFLGKQDQPELADLKKASNVCDKQLTEQRLDEIAGILADGRGSNYRVQLADDASPLRGYGGGIAIVVKIEGDLKIFFPYRDLGAPGDRLIWDVCAGRTMYRNESPHWFHRMLIEGLEEITFIQNKSLLVPHLCGCEDIADIADLRDNKVTEKNAQALGLPPMRHQPIDMRYVAPRNATTIHEELEDGRSVSFKAGWGVEPKFSGMELMGYGVMQLDGSGEALKVFDSELLPTGEPCGREIHEIDPRNGSVIVHHKGTIARVSTIRQEIARRNALRSDPSAYSTLPYQVPIPPYSASIKADLLTKRSAWPFGGDISVLDDIRFGIDQSHIT